MSSSDHFQNSNPQKSNSSKNNLIFLIITLLIIIMICVYAIIKKTQNNTPEESAMSQNNDQENSSAIDYQNIQTFYSSSSNLPSSYGFNYTADKAGDNDLMTWWSPANYDKYKCWIKINFSSEILVKYINIHGGSHYPNFKNYGNLFRKNLRIKTANLEFSDGSTHFIRLNDVDEIQNIQIPEKKSNYILLRPIEYYATEKWPDPCVSWFTVGY